MIRNKWSPVASLMVCCLLVFAMVFSPVLAKEREAPQTKVSEKLIKQFANNEMVTYLVKLKSQVDTEKVALESRRKIQQQDFSPREKELIQRTEVVKSLQDRATDTQKNVVSYLENQKEKGRVKEYHSYFIVNAVAVTSTKDVMNSLANQVEIEKILPDEVRKLISPIKNTIQNKLSGGDAHLEAIEWNINQIGAPRAWNIGINGAGIVVGSIDTGVQWDHPSLKIKYRGYNPSNPNTPDNECNWFDATANKSTPYDDLQHGTHTMGTMVGSEASGANQIGVAPEAKWISAKAFTRIGGSDSNLLSAGEWMIAPKDANGTPHPEKAPDVINNSWGGGSGIDEWYRPMVKNWRAANIFPEFSAGNYDSAGAAPPGSIATPANYPESFATGATDRANKLAAFSLLGPSPYKEMKPEISAPGVNIRSCIPGGQYQGGWNGTSMAGPHVSGVIALLKQANQALTVDEMEQILLSTATPLTDSSFPQSPNNGYGYGLVNAYEAVAVAMKGQGEIKGTVSLEGSQGSVKATVTVIETDQVVKTNEDGTYSVKVASGEYTLRAQAPGYASQDANVQLPSGESTVIQNFTLQQIPKGTVHGKVSSQTTGKPIVGATVGLLEDTTNSVKTDANGEYVITAPVGTRTLRVSASSYYDADISVTITEDATVEQNVTLKPFVEQSAVLAYDNGKPSNRNALSSAGSGWAVKMSPDLTISKVVQVMGGSFLFGADWPTPGGTEFNVSVYDASGSGGSPGKKLAGPFAANALRNGAWTQVDLSSKNIIVSGDFYVLYTQVRGFPYTPALYSDNDRGINRSWRFIGGTWSKVPAAVGNYMIRANVKYKLGE